MASDERQSLRSPTTSRTDSYGDGLGSRTNGNAYNRRSSILDGNDNEYEEPEREVDESRINDRPPQRREDQYIAALQHRFPSRPKSDYAYTRPLGPSIPSGPPRPSTNNQSWQPPPPPPPPPPPQPTPTTNTGGYQSTTRPTTGGANTSDTSEGRTFTIPRLRPVNPDSQNIHARELAGRTSTTTTPTPATTTTTPGGNIRPADQSIGGNRPTTATPINRQQGILKTHESTFEKVPTHGGPVSYLGTGTFSQFEHCLRECLERERRQSGYSSHITRHDYPPTISAHDYSFDSHTLHAPTTDYYHHHYNSGPFSTFSVNDIQHINVAFTKTGVPLFPYSQSYYDSYPSSSVPHSTLTTIHSIYPGERHVTGGVVSACRVVEEDPALRS